MVSVVSKATSRTSYTKSGKEFAVARKLVPVTPPIMTQVKVVWLEEMARYIVAEIGGQEETSKGTGVHVLPLS